MLSMSPSPLYAYSPRASPRSDSLKELTPLRMWPCQYTRASDSLAFLKTIDRVEVNETVKRHGGLHYVFDVYLHNPDNRIPTNRLSITRKSSVADMGEAREQAAPPPPPPREPDYQIERRFAEFEKLRYNIWVHAQQPRPRNGCVYCEDITAYVGDYNRKPSTIRDRLLSTRSRQKDVMETYVNKMITLAIGKAGDGQRSPTCHGFDHIPNRLVRFLRKRSVIEQLH
jgi:hypothetical protein